MAGLSFPLIFFSNFQRPSERDEAANGRIFPVRSHLAVIQLTFFAHELWPQKTKDNVWTRTLACHFIQCQARQEINKLQILQFSIPYIPVAPCLKFNISIVPTTTAVTLSLAQGFPSCKLLVSLSAHSPI